MHGNSECFIIIMRGLDGGGGGGWIRGLNGNGGVGKRGVKLPEKKHIKKNYAPTVLFHIKL